MEQSRKRGIDIAEFEKMDLASADLVAERIEQLKQLLPEVATEGGIDFDKLRLVLGDEVGTGTVGKSSGK